MKQNPMTMNTNSFQNQSIITLSKLILHQPKASKTPNQMLPTCTGSETVHKTNSCFILPKKKKRNNNNMSQDVRVQGHTGSSVRREGSTVATDRQGWMSADWDRAVLKPLWVLSPEINRAWPTAAPWSVLFKACLFHFSLPALISLSLFDTEPCRLSLRRFLWMQTQVFLHIPHHWIRIYNAAMLFLTCLTGGLSSQGNLDAADLQ